VVEFGLAVLPSAGVLFLFYLGVKALVEADRRERTAQARIEQAQAQAEDSRAGLTGDDPSPQDPAR
jgi:threonine/homoserine/homoserine lactone efflux protein